MVSNTVLHLGGFHNSSGGQPPGSVQSSDPGTGTPQASGCGAEDTNTIVDLRGYPGRASMQAALCGSLILEGWTDSSFGWRKLEIGTVYYSGQQQPGS